MKRWNQDEIDFLIENYSKYGLTYCAEKLNRTKISIQSKAKSLNIKYDVGYIYKTEKFIECVRNSNSLSEVCEKLNLNNYYGNRQTIKKQIKIRNIDISHFYEDKSNNTFGKVYELDDILIENSTYTDTTRLKEKLYKNNIKERKCVLCGQDENWNNMKISLILDHINGVNNDNRIENLRIVCPNCNAGLDTFSGKNKKKKANNYFVRENEQNYDLQRENKLKKRRTYCECGKEINYRAKLCSTCNSLMKRKVERPSFEQLINDIKELGYSATGRKYNVSDNSIRKWIKIK